MGDFLSLKIYLGTCLVDVEASITFMSVLLSLKNLSQPHSGFNTWFAWIKCLRSPGRDNSFKGKLPFLGSIPLDRYLGNFDPCEIAVGIIGMGKVTENKKHTGIKARDMFFPCLRLTVVIVHTNIGTFLDKTIFVRAVPTYEHIEIQNGFIGKLYISNKTPWPYAICNIPSTQMYNWHPRCGPLSLICR